MSALDDTIIEKQNWHWRNSMRPIRFFNLDARAAMPYFFLLVYARWITLFICVVSTAIFMFMEHRGLTFPSALRAFRVFLIGSFRPGLNLLRQRKFKDYG